MQGSVQAWLVSAPLRSAHAAVLCRRCSPAQRMPGAAGSKGSDSVHCAGSARPFSQTVHSVNFCQQQTKAARWR